jgi:glutamate carboxypeptidase
MQLNADEEVGSYSSRHLTEAEARASVAVLVLEPAKDLDGKLKTGRKGGGHFRVRVTGKASHAGLDFESGASAIVEVARQIQAISEFTDLERGITVNPGVISGGTRTNVVADLAEVECDFRVLRLEDAGGVERKFRSLAPFDRRCSIAVEGELNRPPLERSDAVIKLFAMARGISRSYGHELGEATVGGGSDGNFTAGMGVPTLDGLGAVGEGAHASNESILVDRIADRTALIAGLIRAL